MGWSLGFDNTWKRDIGYGVPAYCDAPGCGEKIDRGLDYVCGSNPYGGDQGCGLYFCSKHLANYRRGAFICRRCADGKEPHQPTQDHPDWIRHKLTDESWAAWRVENHELVAAMSGMLRCNTKPKHKFLRNTLDNS